MKYFILASVTLVGLSTFLGCYEKIERIFAATFSPANDEIAYAITRYQEFDIFEGDGAAKRKKFRYELRVKNADGSSDRIFRSEKKGHIQGPIYYQPCQNYMILSLKEGDYTRVVKATPNTLESLGRINAKSGLETIDVIPSPDGIYLAKIVTHRDSGPLSPKTESSQSTSATVTISILRSTTLSEINRVTINSVALASAWTADNRIKLRNYAQAWIYDPIENVLTDIEDVSCLVAKTASHYFSLDGRHLEWSKKSLTVHSAGTTSNIGFGCGAYQPSQFSCANNE